MDNAERDKLLQQLQVELADLQLKYLNQELDNKRKRKKGNAVNASILVAFIGILGAIALNLIQQNATNKLEEKKLRSTLILKALDAGDTSKVSKTLLWFVKNKLLDDKDSLITKAANNSSELPVLLGFNLETKDLPTVLVADYTTNPCTSGSANNCWKSDIIANLGDIVSVQIYFHNTGSTVAKDVAVALRPQYSQASTRHVFTGVVAVGDNIVARGSAIVNITQSETLSFIPSSVRFFPNQSNVGYIISGEEYLFSNYGLNIGDVQTGWVGQGVLVADFKIGSTGK
jgi:hypothetical protein